MKMGEYEKLLEPGRIGRLNIRNRIIFNPTETLFGTAGGEVTDRVIDYYARRAAGGAGLMVVHSAQACTKLDTVDPYPGSLRVDDNTFMPMLSELADAAHRHGAKIAILVSAGGGAQALGFPYDRGMEGIWEPLNVGSSDTRSLVAQRPVRPLTTGEIEKFVEVYGLAARRVRDAGFDAFYVHSVGGYLISQFLSPYFNKRDDAYGGDLAGRFRFLRECVESCMENAGRDFPIVVRMSVDEHMPGALGLDEALQVASWLEEMGVAAIDASAGLFESMSWLIPPRYMDKGALVYLAEAVRKAVGIPVIAQGRLFEPELAERVLSEGRADFIALARGFISEPMWAARLVEGRAGEIRKCITCNYCIKRVFDNLTIRCAINPVTGRESEFPEQVPKAEMARKVVVVGAGPAGMEAARVAAERGHVVTLYERSDRLGGGQLRLAGTAPHKSDVYDNITGYYASQFEKLDNLEVLLGREATAREIMAAEPDVVVLATGGCPLRPDIEGAEGGNVVQACDVLGGAPVEGSVIIAGGGLVGAECADFLSEKGHEVTVVEMLDEIIPDEDIITRMALLGRLQEKCVEILSGNAIRRILPDGLETEDREGGVHRLGADNVVLALGLNYYNPLEGELERFPGRRLVIGDAKEPRKIQDAVAEGFFAGLSA